MRTNTMFILVRRYRLASITQMLFALFLSSLMSVPAFAQGPHGSIRCFRRADNPARL